MEKSNTIHNKFFLTLIVLSATLLIAGCTGGDTGAAVGTAGADSLTLSIDTEGRDLFDSNEAFLISVEAENTGPVNAENVEVRLQGYDGISGTALGTYTSLSPGTLERPNTDEGLAGGVGNIEWDVIAPYVSATSPDREISLTAAVRYDTKSIVSQKVVIAEASHLTELEARGERVPASPTQEARNGPVGIAMEAPAPYVRMSGSEDDFILRVTVYNDGSGTVYDATGERDRVSSIRLSIPSGLTVDESKCDFDLRTSNSLDGVKVLLIDSSSSSAKQNKLRLTEGGYTRTVQCHLQSYSDRVNGYNTFAIESEVSYTYVQSVSTSLDIIGTSEGALALEITDPSTTSQGTWTAATETITFTLAYQGELVTDTNPSFDVTDDSYLNFTLINGSTELSVPVSLTGNNYSNGVWSVQVTAPTGTTSDHITLRGTANYLGETATDRNVNSVELQ
ncbi:MAG: hypothetical protein QGI80_00040 [archaeon]|jgi:hypothetical protein|nr:hypothetical protein [archaeon]